MRSFPMCWALRLFVAMLPLWSTAIPAKAASPDPAPLIARAVEYGLPAFEIARLTYNFTYNPQNPGRVPVNSFIYRRALFDHTNRAVTTPNHDTLYASAVIDLSSGPVRLDVPAFGKRYYSIALVDAYTNNFAYIGTRSTGGDAGSYEIAGPAWRGRPPSGAVLIRAPGNHITALMRILVNGPSDYAEAHRLQDAFRLSGPQLAPARPDLIRPVAGDAENFVAVVNQVLQDDPPPDADRPTLNALAIVGIGARAPALTQEQQQWWKQYFGTVRAALIASSKQLGVIVQGWQYLPPDTGNFGTDYPTRAKIAIQGATANVPAESTYSLALVDGSGARLDDAHHYRLHLPANTPPADSFWSLSIYELMPDGGMFFDDNELHRYAIGNLTEGLVRNADGSLDIAIQKERPSGATANWLPIPARDFSLIMRAYLPRPSLLDGSFQYPGVERLD